jgi:hypothetical protein
VLRSPLPSVVGRVRAAGREVSGASRLAGTLGSSIKAGLHLLLV